MGEEYRWKGVHREGGRKGLVFLTGLRVEFLWLNLLLKGLNKK